MTENIKIGDYVKVYLLGESPYVTALGITKLGSLIGKIDNHLINSDNHGYYYNDIVEFYKKSYIFNDNKEYFCWEPMGIFNLNLADT